MRERIKPTRSGLFAIELLISVGIFSLCAAICVGLFVRSEVISRDSADLNRAVTEARSAAECFKAAGGDMEAAARLTGGQLGAGGALVLEYDESWNRLGPGAAGYFLLTVEPVPAEGFAAASLSVQRRDTLEQLLVWDIAALEVAS